MSTVGSRYSAHPTHSRPATCRAASEATKAIATSVVSHQGSWSDRGGQPCRLPKSGYDGMLRSGPVTGPLVMTGLFFFFLLGTREARSAGDDPHLRNGRCIQKHAEYPDWTKCILSTMEDSISSQWTADYCMPTPPRVDSSGRSLETSAPFSFWNGW